MNQVGNLFSKHFANNFIAIKKTAIELVQLTFLGIRCCLVMVKKNCIVKKLVSSLGTSRENSVEVFL